MSEGGAPLSLGLSQAEASARLAAEGPNQLPEAERRTLLRIVLDVLREPMFGLLLGAGAIYLLLGDLREALVLLGFATISVGIAIVQESRSERVLAALRDLTSPRALVIRDGKHTRIAGREVVRGDVVVLAEGDRVPADGIVRRGQDLLTDEALLTGEALPVRKVATSDFPSELKIGGDDLPFVFSGTLVVRGHGLAEVTATGPRSQIGKIGSALGAIKSEAPPLQAQTRRLVRAMAILGITAAGLVVGLYGLLRHSWLEGLLGGIALSMSMLPEEFPLVLTVFMVMGAWRMSRARVLTRRAAAIETLGAATILCSDKTGTLTQNRMSVAALWADGESFEPAAPADPDLPESFHLLAEFAILASAPEPFDPMEAAFHAFGLARQITRRHPSGKWTPMREYGLSQELLAVSHVWRRANVDEVIVAAKGAPEAIAGLCRLDAEGAAALNRAADAMAARGMRVLGIARGAGSARHLPESPRDFTFTFLGLVGLADPLRASVPAAIRECQTAGIKVAMITGDYAITAQAIAAQAGIAVQPAMTGDAIERLSDAELSHRLKTSTIFARVLPQQKLRLVNAFKQNGEIVAMTGDGVNDAPSLKAAHIGIAMGGRGTDVAREAAAIVLLDDDFGSIVRTIRLGRRIYDNLRKAMGYIIAVHVPIAGLSLLPLIFDWPLILTPIHIAFLEMVIDPVCSLVFEAEGEEENVMRRPPRNPQSPLLPASLIAWNVLQGTLVLIVLATVMILAIHRGMPETEVRALVFVSLILSNVGLIFVNRSFSASLFTALSRRNRTLWLVLGVTLSVLGVALFWLPARSLFRFGPLHVDDLGICLAASVVILVLLEALKPIWQARLTS